MSGAADFDTPDHFTAGALGPPGQRVFYLQARQARRVLTLRLEKEQVRALGEYLAALLARLPAAGAPPEDRGLLEPVEAAWVVGSVAVGYDEEPDRVVIVATELVETEGEAEPATARFSITRSQAAGFVERERALMKGGRPLCPMCSQPRDPAGHVCPRANGHVARGG